MKPGANTGRVGRIHTYLSGQTIGRSAKEVLAVVDAGGDLQSMCWTLNYMAKRGYVRRLGVGKGRARFCAADTPAPVATAKATRTKPRAPTQTIVHKTRTQRRIQAPNFYAAPGTVDPISTGAITASQKIAADIAAFQACGGTIQQLGCTFHFHPIAAVNDDAN